MAGALPGLEGLSPQAIEDAASYRFGIVVASWNSEITSALKEGALNALQLCQVPLNHIHLIQVPGSFEIPLAAQWLFETHKADAVVCLGCILRGETRHDEYLAHAVSKGLMDLNIKFSRPAIFGVLTVETMDQAKERSGGKWGNKGAEAIAGALQMLRLQKELYSSEND